MILTLDIGNSNIVMGIFDGGKLALVSRLHTNAISTGDEYAVTISSILGINGLSAGGFSGGIISSVVPKLTNVLRDSCRSLLKCRMLLVSSGIKTGINIQTDNPSVLGSDFVCAAAGAAAHYRLPCVIADLGTATKFSAVKKGGVFAGTSIMPGVNISLDALAAKTAQLPHIGLDGATPPLVGTNTVDSMRSGIIYGTAATVDGMIELYRRELGEETEAIATGGVASAIIPHCRQKIILDSDLILKGLYEIYKKNSHAEN
ncbi:MAG: type III pantothenate kinase [Oscillospiraceae bacterium]|nr:type III pantothenate kinase [Oscillospiraceae bacterium]